MSDMLRSFIAVKVNPEPALRQAVKEIKEELSSETINWVDENNLYIPLVVSELKS